MSGYTKLFASLIHSTVWREPDYVRLVWITMLAMADRNGVVEAAIPGLADAARVTLEECVLALERLRQPDRFSRTKDHEGRRISDIDGGWLILNHAQYRDRLTLDQYRQKHAERQRRYREKKKLGAPKQPPKPSAADEQRKARRSKLGHFVPDDWTIKDAHRKLALGLVLDVEAQAAQFRSYEFATARSDWDRTFSGWLRRAPEFMRRAVQNGGKKTDLQQILERSARIQQGES